MASAFKCDSCGKFDYEINKRIVKVEYDTYEDYIGKLDLCVSCYAEFKKYMKKFIKRHHVY